MEANAHPAATQSPILTKRWHICGTLTTTSALHIGTGQSHALHQSADSGSTSLVQRDAYGCPCISGSSIKGVLRPAAKANFDAAWVKQLFGELGGTHADHCAGQIQFLTATLDPLSLRSSASDENVALTPHYDKGRHTGLLTGHARDRKTKAVANMKLFTHEVVPVGAKFNVAFIVRSVSSTSSPAITQPQVQAFLNLLTRFDGTLEGLQLGGGTAIGQGMAKWNFTSCDALAPEVAKDWWQRQVQLDSPTARLPYAPSGLKSNASETVAPSQRITAPLSITIDGPFLCNDPVDKTIEKNADVNFRPRRLHNGDVELPGRSLHGALRAQAERICRTVGIEVPEGHAVPPVQNGNIEALDIVSFLFGAPGWKSPLALTSFVCPRGQAIVHKQEFVAIDRFTGGSAEGQKFNGESILNPTLTGHLSIDVIRMKAAAKKHPDRVESALGLLLLTLRDLDEGDIPLGYGASAKGYGQIDTRHTQTAKAVVAKLLPNHTETNCLKAWKLASKSCQMHLSATLHDAGLLAAADQTSITPPTPTTASGDFHNPYLFLPTNPPVRQSDWQTTHDFLARSPSHHWHDRYYTALQENPARPVFSGRINCTLQTVSATVIGATQARPDNAPNTTPTTVTPFKLGGTIAIPSTSLRGMIGSLVEAASQSAFRVLTDQSLSYRVPLDKSMSAMGIVVDLKRHGLFLLPLALPTLEVVNRTARIPENIGKAFFSHKPTDMPITAPLKALIEDLQPGIARRPKSPRDMTPQLASQIRDMQTRLDLLPSYGSRTGEGQRELTTSALSVAEVHKVTRNHATGRYSIDNINADTFHPKLQEHNTYLLGHKLVASNSANKLRGIVRKMYSEHRGDELPPNKKHETWLPYPGDVGTAVSALRGKAFRDEPITMQEIRALGMLPIPLAVIARFNWLADERTQSQDKKADLHSDELLPYNPIHLKRQTTPPERDASGVTPKHPERLLRIKDYDTVYFEPDKDGESVEKISFSSIWRDRIEHAKSALPNAYTTTDFVKSIHPELVPFHAERKTISPAESVLGFVNVSPVNGSGEKPEKLNDVLTFASKLRFSFGTLAKGTDPSNLLGAPVTLKILGSPKPPSPAMYFKPVGGQGYISKATLAAAPQSHRPNGRKVYLHAHRTDGKVSKLDTNGVVDHARGQLPWQSNAPAGADAARVEKYRQNNNQRMQVTPIVAGTSFSFHINFDNLSQAELELLSFALAPCVGFEHRLGMGKSLGLGSVAIHVDNIQWIDRVARYTSDTLAQSRSVSAAGDTAKHLAEAGALATHKRDPALLRAIQLTGLTSAVTKPVHTPQSSGKETEHETFEWFANNDNPILRMQPPPQNITPITAQATALPSLRRQRRVSPPRN